MKKLLLSLLITSASLTVSAQENLYIIGDATNAGWDLGSALEMNKIQDGWFTWFGHLDNNEGAATYKFLETNTDWLPSYNIDTESASGNKLFKRTDYGQPDEKIWVIDGQAGFYFVEAVTREDVLENNRKKLDAIYPIGGGTPYNWDMGQSISLGVSPANPAIFSGVVELTINDEANIKFLTENEGNWLCPTIYPAIENNVNIEEGQEMDFVMQSNKYGVTDRQFIVTRASKYLITINFETMKIKFVEDNTTSIEEDSSDMSNAKISYFDLMGNKVLDPTEGVFIKKIEVNGKTLTQKTVLK